MNKLIVFVTIFTASAIVHGSDSAISEIAIQTDTYNFLKDMHDIIELTLKEQRMTTDTLNAEFYKQIAEKNDSLRISAQQFNESMQKLTQKQNKLTQLTNATQAQLIEENNQTKQALNAERHGKMRKFKNVCWWTGGFITGSAITTGILALVAFKRGMFTLNPSIELVAPNRI
jgi:hypothetical protein